MPVFFSFFSARRPGLTARFLRLSARLGLALLFLIPYLQAAKAQSASRAASATTRHVVISEFRTRGAGGASDELIEIFNPTPNPIDISGWKISGSNASGSTSVRATIPGGVLLNPGQFYLVANAAYAGSVTADLTYSSGITDDGGVALLDSANGIVDQVGMSAGSAYQEGTPLSPLTANADISHLRANICEDSNNNQADFPAAASDPQNSASAAFACPPPPAFGALSLVISEVAWGGTQAEDLPGQWIELYNPGPDALDLTGAFLRIPSKGDIALTGTLNPGEYYLIERNESSTSAASRLISAFPLLDPAGDRLELYNPSAVLIDSANANGGPWPAGERFFSYTSMERRLPADLDADTAWQNYFGGSAAVDRDGNPINGTPGTANSSGQTVTPSPTATITPSITPSLTPTASFTPTFTLSPSASPTAAASRSVVINEIAWMGTAASSADEWIELYNPGSAVIDISGWKLISSDNNFSVTLNGSIAAGAYFLLERTDDQTVADIAADQIFSGSLSNNGLALKLIDASNRTIDTANGNGGAWPAGISSSYCSMERRGAAYADSDSIWFTNGGLLKNGTDAAGNAICGTPKNINWAYVVTPTATSAAASRTPSRTPTRTPVPVSSVLINEFLPHAISDWNQDGKTDFGDEYIEIINVSGQSVSLSGWKLDDQPGDSSAFSLPNVNLAPGGRLVYFAAETGLLLSNRGDSVRLFNANGQISDAYTYTQVVRPDVAYCRLPDGKFDWSAACAPTPNLVNAPLQAVEANHQPLPSFCLFSGFPAALFAAECAPSGLDSWSRSLWDGGLPAYQLWLEQNGETFLVE